MTRHAQSRTFVGLLLAALTITGLDQLTKAWVVQAIPLHGSMTVVKGFFSLSHVRNPGAAFSLFAEYHHPLARAALMAFSAIVAAFLVVTLWRLARSGWSLLGFSLAMVLGGAVGNLIDRLHLGSVVDFLAFDLGPYHWPDFNLADSAIVCGSLLLIWTVVGEGKTDPQRAAPRS